MILIAHRGNIDGPNPRKENSPQYILDAISNGFNVEVDIWIKNEKLFLGHDEPQYPIKNNFLDTYKSKLWCHAKNIAALEYLLSNDFHTFWHQNDDYTITSKGFIWTYPNKHVEKGIYVLPEKFDTCIPKACLGICSDYVLNVLR